MKQKYYDNLKIGTQLLNLFIFEKVKNKNVLNDEIKVTCSYCEENW